MLKHLYIKNFTLIDQLDIDFHPGFSVITGETGAGKSIILGAIGLLLGNRADSKLVKRPQGDDGRTVKCTIEAHFDLSRYDFAPFFEENDLGFSLISLGAGGYQSLWAAIETAALDQCGALPQKKIAFLIGDQWFMNEEGCTPELLGGSLSRVHGELWTE